MKLGKLEERTHAIRMKIKKLIVGTDQTEVTIEYRDEARLGPMEIMDIADSLIEALDPHSGGYAVRTDPEGFEKIVQYDSDYDVVG